MNFKFPYQILGFKSFKPRGINIWSKIIFLFSFFTSAQDNFAGLQHWEIPSKNPDRIILTFHGDPASSRAVTWRTDTNIKKGVA